MALKIGVLVSGRGSNLQALLDKQRSGQLLAEVAVVISDQPGARALDRAKDNNIANYYFNPKQFLNKAEYENKVLEKLKYHQVELVVLAGYMRLLSDVLLDAYPRKIMNIHPSLLPSFKGLNAQKQAVDYGVKFSGCTVHFVDKGMDTGPIILQKTVPVKDDDDEDSLSQRILEQEHILYAQAINLYAAEKLKIVGRKVAINND